MADNQNTLQVNPNILVNREGDFKERLSTGSVYIKNKDLYLFLGSESIALGLKPGIKIATATSDVSKYSLLNKGGTICTIISQIENLKDNLSNLNNIEEEKIKENPDIVEGIDEDIRGYRKKIFKLKQRLSEINIGRLIDRF